AAPAADTVVLLHGLGRGPASMWPLARSLEREGYHVVNVRYPSQRADIATLAEGALGPVFGDARAPSSARIHIVTHSLGGILVRRYLKDHGAPASLGRVVMLAPPNSGSEIVDTLADWRVYAWINGPAGLDLGTAPHHAPAALGAPPTGVEIGVIAGEYSWNPFFSALIPGPDDGKVAVARTHLAGEADHLTLPYSHTWLMNRRETRRQVAAFLREGHFARSAAPGF
ncbi:MAG: alpha/beta fold hydrolase, partial [Burkholderiales bacterium]|nr:alpha/beta fold hydrolase [Opitutaceae bacterium]